MKFEHYKTRNGSEIDIPIPTSYRDCLELLKSDYFRIYGRVDSLGVIWLKSFRDRALKHLFWFLQVIVAVSILYVNCVMNIINLSMIVEFMLDLRSAMVCI